MFSNKQKPKAAALLALMLVLPMLNMGCDEGERGAQSVETEQGLWTCGMHPNVLQNEPGNCPICNMKLTPVKKTSSDEHDTDASQEELSRLDGLRENQQGERKVLYWRAPMDPGYISEKPGKSPMGMDLVPVYEGEEGTSGSEIRIDPTVVQNMGVRTTEVQRMPFYRLIRTVGHVDYNEEAMYAVSLKFDGWIEELLVNRMGDHVQKGQPLLSIYSPELVATQAEYLLAFENQQKLGGSDIGQVSSGAQSLLEASRQRLQYWDIGDSEIEKLERSGHAQRTLTIRSPNTGIVVHKNAVEGAFFKAGTDLFRIADLSRVWVYAHIFEYELPWIRIGQSLRMELPYIPGRAFSGTIDYIYPYLDSKTRDVKIRLVFENPTLELKPEMYANITIESRAGEQELVIPGEAVIRTGKRNVVFISLGEGRFRPQDVRIGPEGDNGVVQVLTGLQEGDRIVTSAQFMLDSESRLRDTIQKMRESQKPVSPNEPE